MRGGRTLAGWTRIPGEEFRAAAATALREQPALYPKLRLALSMSSARLRVERETRDRYLGWLSQAEAAVTTEAERVQAPADPAAVMAPTPINTLSIEAAE